MSLLLSLYQARPLLDSRTSASARSSPDLGITLETVQLDRDGVHFSVGFVSWTQLQKIAHEERKVYLVEDGEIHAVQVFSETTGWVRSLCPTSGAPTVLVSGIPMHRIKDTDPLQDTREKMRAFGVVEGRVLDTATGAGYTAIAAAQVASDVVTIELDPAAIQLARYNPYAAELFTRSNIRQVIGDAADEIPNFEIGSFAGVIHDPPTMSLGGDLYSEDFYRQLHRILKRGGRLFHYISDPDSHLGKKLWPGVIKRLGQAGFKRVERHPAAYGVSAVA